MRQQGPTCLRFPPPGCSADRHTFVASPKPIGRETRSSTKWSLGLRNERANSVAYQRFSSRAAGARSREPLLLLGIGQMLGIHEQSAPTDRPHEGGLIRWPGG